MDGAEEGADDPVKSKPAVAHFTGDAHALAAGGIFGLLLRERNRDDGIIKSCTPVLDEAGNYKPYIDVEMHLGGRFRIIVVELP